MLQVHFYEGTQCFMARVYLYRCEIMFYRSLKLSRQDFVTVSL